MAALAATRLAPRPLQAVIEIADCCAPIRADRIFAASVSRFCRSHQAQISQFCARPSLHALGADCVGLANNRQACPLAGSRRLVAPGGPQPGSRRVRPRQLPRKAGRSRDGLAALRASATPRPDSTARGHALDARFCSRNGSKPGALDSALNPVEHPHQEAGGHDRLRCLGHVVI